MSRFKFTSKLAWLSLFAVGVIISVVAISSAGRRAPTNPTRAFRAEASRRLALLPPIIFWAWERPEKLDSIDIEKAGVAFLAKTIYLRNEKTVARPRLQTLAVRPGTVLIAVARIESDRFEPPSLSHDQIKDAANEITELAQMPNVKAVQIDFDATVSERAFYAELLTTVRKTLPPGMGLSVTALASWCQGDNWLDKLPVDEAVPMLFRMGIDRPGIVSGLASGEEFHSPLCRQSSGISVDENVPYAPTGERLYVFNPNSWSPNSVEKVMEKYQR